MAHEELPTTRNELDDYRRTLVFNINNYDLVRKENEEVHERAQAKLKQRLFCNVEILAAVEREIHLLDIVELCNTPNLFAPIV